MLVFGEISDKDVSPRNNQSEIYKTDDLAPRIDHWGVDVVAPGNYCKIVLRIVHEVSISWHIYHVTVALNVSNSLINPVIYAPRIPEFR